MNVTDQTSKQPVNSHLLFNLFKYAVYALLAYNIFLWFQEDFLASAETFGDTVNWRNVVEAYSATIDTAAWVVLLLLFELETAVIPDEKLQGWLKWFMTATVAVCYALITWAFYGYLLKYGVITDIVSFNKTSVGLAIVDIINAGTWLIIVILLQIEVWLQLKEMLTGRLMLIAKLTKGFFYSLLFACAIYWGFNGTFLDFWDAFLWLIAFIFIELNIFRWHEEG